MFEQTKDNGARRLSRNEIAAELKVPRQTVQDWITVGGCKYLGGGKLPTIPELRPFDRLGRKKHVATAAKEDVDLLKLALKKADDPKWETTKQAAKRTGKSNQKIRNLVKSKQVRKRVCHGVTQVRKTSVDDCLAKEQIEPVPKGSILIRDVPKKYDFATVSRCRRWLKGKDLPPGQPKPAVILVNQMVKDGAIEAVPSVRLATLDAYADAYAREWGIAVDDDGTKWASLPRLAKDHDCRVTRFKGKQLKNLDRCLPEGKKIGQPKRRTVPILINGKIVFRRCAVLPKAIVDAAMKVRRRFPHVFQKRKASPKTAARDNWIDSQKKPGISYGDIARELERIAGKRGWRAIGRESCWEAHKRFLAAQNGSAAKNGANAHSTSEQSETYCRNQFILDSRPHTIWKSIIAEGERRWPGEMPATAAGCNAAMRRHANRYGLALPEQGNRGRPESA